MFDDWRPRAVVFDCDGLLVDTESCWTAAERELCARRGREFTAADEAALVGASVPSACEMLAGRAADGSTVAQIEVELVALVTEVVARDARPMPGARVLVDAARASVPVAVASNSPRRLLEQALRCAAMRDAFDTTVAADEVAEPKPAPDLYLAVCARLGVDPADALAVEDSATGVAAASAAGLASIGAPTLVGSDIGATVTVAGLDDPGLVAWVRGWPSRA